MVDKINSLEVSTVFTSDLLGVKAMKFPPQIFMQIPF